MSHRTDEKERRRKQQLAAEAAALRAARIRSRAFWTLGIALVAGLVAAAFALPGKRSTTPAGAHGQPAADARVAPDFRVADVASRRTLALGDLRGKKALLFFSEGASCQACLVQAAELQKSQALRRAGIRLVSISTDTPDVLAQVARQYGISSSLLADSDRSMSRAYGQLGRGGMGHPDTDGHSFVLLDERGRITWEQAYQEMYVPTQRLLADMGV